MLQAAHDDGVPWRGLRNGYGLINLPPHGCALADLWSELHALSRRGLIAWVREDRSRTQVLPPDFDLATFESAALRRGSVCGFLGYELTFEGGELWGEAAQVDWSRHYVDEQVVPAGSPGLDESASDWDTWQYVALSRSRVEELLAADIAYGTLIDDVRWDVIDDFRQTYWRPPCTGVRATFRMSTARPIALCTVANVLADQVRSAEWTRVRRWHQCLVPLPSTTAPGTPR
ncbi:MAG: hypothetical protein JST92_03935 [Deltaproteobacteria bacterium]|nr:hypothetical protein [Deltaproteobacteria bacterium]